MVSIPDQPLWPIHKLQELKYKQAVSEDLAVESITGVSIRDVFEKTSLAEAHHLVNVGFYLKRTDVIEKFRVINFRSKPKLLTAKGSKQYVEILCELLKNAVEGLGKN